MFTLRKYNSVFQQSVVDNKDKQSPRTVMKKKVNEMSIFEGSRNMMDILSSN